MELVGSNSSLKSVDLTLIIFSLGSPSSPLPTSWPPALRRSPRTTKGKTVPLLPLDIKIGHNQPRGTKRCAATAAHVDKPHEEQSGDSDPGAGGVTSVRRSARLQSLDLRPKQRRRVGDDLETARATPHELWVAEGEVRPFNSFRNKFSQTLTLLAGQVQAVQASGERGL